MSDAVSPPMGGQSEASQSRASRRARSLGRRPLQFKLSRRAWWLVAAGTVILLTGGHVFTPLRSGWNVARDLVSKDAEYRALRADNDAREEEIKFLRTPEGMDSIVRHKLYLTLPGEILVNPVGGPATATGNPATSRPVHLTVTDWRQDGAEWLRSTGAILHRWAVDPPEVVAARDEARTKHKAQATPGAAPKAVPTVVTDPPQ